MGGMTSAFLFFHNFPFSVLSHQSPEPQTHHFLLQVCNGRRDCLEGEDEADCEEKECPAGRPHRCKDGSCVVASAPCNNIEDCADGSDEINCTHHEPEDPEDESYEDYYYEGETERPSPPPATSATTPMTKPTNMEETHEEETVVEGIAAGNPVEPKESEEDFGDEKDIEAAETMFETVEEREPAESREQGASRSTSLAPSGTLTLLLVPLFVFGFRGMWTR